MTRSIAASKCSSLIVLAALRAAMRAASLQMLAMSAPEKPGVSVANLTFFFKKKKKLKKN